MIRGHRRSVLVLCGVTLAATACGVFQAPPAFPSSTPSHANSLVNGDFERGPDGWTQIPAEAEGPVDASDAQAHGGTRSLALRLQGASTKGAGLTTGAAQSLNTTVFPEVVSGFYRVDVWQPNAASQNVRFVVSVRGGDFDDGLGLHQARFVIAGSDAAAKLLPGVTQVYVSRATPPLRRWSYFGYPVRQAFIDRFGKVPTRWEAIDVSVEAGYDEGLAGPAVEAAEVLFDDLYAGPLAQNPNRPGDP